MVSTKKWFDGLIRENLEKAGYGPFGYELNNKTYPMYYTKGAFQAFQNEMKRSYPRHYERYRNGHGSELKETSTPPKMASVASSSRFAYLALRDGAQAIGGTEYVEFEHACRIRGVRGTPPQLDACTTDEKGDPIYVEVKCHEIFDPHTVGLRAAYWENIYGEKNAFGFPVKQDKPANTVFHIPPELFGIGQEDLMVDIKQLLCHLMGIASQKEETRTATLVYLFFRPAAAGEDERRMDEIFKSLTGQIDRVFSSAPIRNFCRAHRIDLKMVVQRAAVMGSLTKETIGYQRDYPHK